jgi:predicted alpha/beta hydrolase family esterase
VGYTPDGFIVQNSWGSDWAFHGFAVVTYEDWVANGMDAWVAVLGAPMHVARANNTLSDRPLQTSSYERAEFFGLLGGDDDEIEYENREVKPLPRSEAYRHALVLGNEGRPLRRLLEYETATDGLRHVAHDRPADWFARNDGDVPKLAIYAHGGLNKEAAGIKRTQILAPYFRANGIYPLFAVWKTGLWETLGSILEDVADRYLPWRSTGWLDQAANWLKERKDRSVELAARGAIKPVWSEMKENAAMSGRDDGATVLVAQHLAALAATLPKFEVHLIGHSAGSILLGHLLDHMHVLGIPVRSLHLFAPACTTRFAVDHYLPRMADGDVLAKTLIRVHNMNDERERADSIGPYGKSLLYLVSRALEPRHKTPLMGLAASWDTKTTTPSSDLWHGAEKAVAKAWIAGADGRVEHVLHKAKNVSTGHAEIPLAHGSFDNDVKVIGETIRKIRRKPLAFKIENLAGF